VHVAASEQSYFEAVALDATDARTKYLVAVVGSLRVEPEMNLVRCCLVVLAPLSLCWYARLQLESISMYCSV
jgi:hypothetical protein